MRDFTGECDRAQKGDTRSGDYGSEKADEGSLAPPYTTEGPATTSGTSARVVQDALHQL